MRNCLRDVNGGGNAMAEEDKGEEARSEAPREVEERFNQLHYVRGYARVTYRKNRRCCRCLPDTAVIQFWTSPLGGRVFDWRNPLPVQCFQFDDRGSLSGAPWRAILCAQPARH